MLLLYDLNNNKEQPQTFLQFNDIFNVNEFNYNPILIGVNLDNKRKEINKNDKFYR